MVAAHVRDGEWRRVARGVYVPTDGPSSARSDALARVVGLHARLTAPTCFSHTSAAVLHGLPLWEVGIVIHVYQPSSASGDCSPQIARHAPYPPPQDVIVLDGIRATTLGRTAWDCATSLPPLGGLVILDAALRAGLDRAELDARAAAAAGRRGSVRGLAVLQIADDGAESPWETACRFVLVRAGLPVPQTQVPVQTRLGTFWATLGWPEWKVLLEYDGRTKYADRPTEELVREKRRHDAVVDEGYRLLRVTHEDVRHPTTLVSRVAAALPTSVRPPSAPAESWDSRRPSPPDRRDRGFGTRSGMRTDDLVPNPRSRCATPAGGAGGEGEVSGARRSPSSAPCSRPGRRSPARDPTRTA